MALSHSPERGPIQPEARESPLNAPESPLNAPVFEQGKNVLRRMRLAADMPNGELAIQQQFNQLQNTQDERQTLYRTEVRYRFQALVQSTNTERLQADADATQFGPDAQRMLRDIIGRISMPEGRRASYLTARGYVDASQIATDLKNLSTLPTPGRAEQAIVRQLTQVLSSMQQVDEQTTLLNANRSRSSEGGKRIALLLGLAAIGMAVLTGLISHKNKNKSIFPFLYLGLAAIPLGPYIGKSRDQQHLSQVAFLKNPQFIALSRKAGLRGAQGETTADVLLTDRARDLSRELVRKKITMPQFLEKLGADAQTTARLAAMQPEEIAQLTQMMGSASDSEAKEAVRFFVKNDIGPQSLKQLEIA